MLHPSPLSKPNLLVALFDLAMRVRTALCHGQDGQRMWTEQGGWVEVVPFIKPTYTVGNIRQASEAHNPFFRSEIEAASFNIKYQRTITQSLVS